MRLGGTFDVDSKEKEILEIENQLLEKEIWSDIEKSTDLNKRKTFLEKSLATYKDSLNKLSDNKLLLDMALEEDDQTTIKQISDEILEIRPSIENLEFTKMFSGKMDSSNAFVDIQSIDVEIAPETSIQEVFVIANLGESDLEFNIDADGYSWKSSNDENFDYLWIDISDESTLINFNHNDYASDQIMQLDFEFPFFNSSYANLIINPNGWVGFGEDNTGWDNTSLPNSSSPNPAIMGWGSIESRTEYSNVLLTMCCCASFESKNSKNFSAFSLLGECLSTPPPLIFT